MTTMSQKIENTSTTVTVGCHTFTYDDVSKVVRFGIEYLECFIGGILDDRFIID